MGVLWGLQAYVGILQIAEFPMWFVVSFEKLTTELGYWEKGIVDRGEVPSPQR